MKVRMLVSLSGTRNGQPWPPMGNEIDLPDAEARDMIQAQQAIPVTQHRKAETATGDETGVEERATATERPLTTESGPAPRKATGRGNRS